jgi:hypothetical protein
MVSLWFSARPASHFAVYVKMFYHTIFVCTTKINTVLNIPEFSMKKNCGSGLMQLSKITTKKGNVHGKKFFIAQVPCRAFFLESSFFASMLGRLKRCRTDCLSVAATIFLLGAR